MTNYYNVSTKDYRESPHHRIMLFGLMSIPFTAMTLTTLFALGVAMDLIIPAGVIGWVIIPFGCLIVWVYYDLKLAKTKEQLQKEKAGEDNEEMPIEIHRLHF